MSFPQCTLNFKLKVLFLLFEFAELICQNRVWFYGHFTYSSTKSTNYQKLHLIGSVLKNQLPPFLEKRLSPCN